MLCVQYISSISSIQKLDRKHTTNNQTLISLQKWNFFTSVWHEYWTWKTWAVSLSPNTSVSVAYKRATLAEKLYKVIILSFRSTNIMKLMGSLSLFILRRENSTVKDTHSFLHTQAHSSGRVHQEEKQTFQWGHGVHFPRLFLYSENQPFLDPVCLAGHYFPLLPLTFQ